MGIISFLKSLLFTVTFLYLHRHFLCLQCPLHGLRFPPKPAPGWMEIEPWNNVPQNNGTSEQ